MQRNDEAKAIWHAVYDDLSEGKPGLVGALTARAEAQVLRLQCLYALLDGSDTIRAEHLTAALALWRYCEASVHFIFIGMTGSGPGHMTVDTCGKKFFPTLHMTFKANRISAEVPKSIKESCCGNMVIRLV